MNRTTTTVSAAAILALALTACSQGSANDAEPAPEAATVTVTDQAGPASRIAWEVSTSGDGPGTTVIVDAMSGNVIGTEDD